ncbi:MAG TPA: ATP-grasp domain-containing protein [Patescibacteria group bacterium]|nr:ATP-grasp domain-containing protein [Patescibacteria group bacterium]
MILFEFEGKKLLKKYGIDIPTSQLVSSLDEKLVIQSPFVVKAQVLSGKRKDAGGITESVSEVLGKVINKEKVEKVLVEEKIEFSKEHYVSISYDTNFRCPVVTYSESGGTGVEERGSHVFPINILTQEPDYPSELKITDDLKDFISKLFNLFLEEDATLTEVNPLVESNGKLIALDAKINLDDTAFGRHKDRIFSPRVAPGHSPTEREIAAKKIDEDDYRGTAGSTYFDLPGDIAVLASGGGASLTAMDALIGAGGSPANFTEYSGNPPKEKVEKLTEIVLSKPGLHALWVVGAIANFTDIYETLSGFLEALRKISPKPKYPIVIRRGGPNDEKAFEMLRKVKEFDLYLYGEEVSMTQSAKKVTDLAKKYAATT